MSFSAIKLIMQMVSSNMPITQYGKIIKQVKSRLELKRQDTLSSQSFFEIQLTINYIYDYDLKFNKASQKLNVSSRVASSIMKAFTTSKFVYFP